MLKIHFASAGGDVVVRSYRVSSNEPAQNWRANILRLEEQLAEAKSDEEQARQHLHDGEDCLFKLRQEASRMAEDIPPTAPVDFAAELAQSRSSVHELQRERDELRAQLHSDARSAAWSDIFVVVRGMLSDERATHRTRWWRRALELQAVSAKEGSVSHCVTSRRHLEMALEKMEPEFGCVGSRNAGFCALRRCGVPTVLQAARGAGNACTSGVVVALLLQTTQCAPLWPQSRVGDWGVDHCQATREIDDQFWDLVGDTEPERRSAKLGAIRILYRKVRARHFPIRRFSCG